MESLEKSLENRKKPVNEYNQTKKIPLNEWDKYFGSLYDNTDNTVEPQSQ